MTSRPVAGAPSIDAPLKVINVAGARPNFMKIAPIVREMEKDPRIEPILIHTGQHYDKELSEDLFRDLEIPEPTINLNVGSGRHGKQTARVLEAFEEILLQESPHLVLVVGDVNSTVACALAASKLKIPVAHVEAGLRSFDRRMPEETNRVLTDAISDYLFTTEPSGEVNLAREGVSKERVFPVGNVMIDTLLRFKKRAEKLAMVERLGLAEDGIALVTIHRAENVDSKEVLGGLVDALTELSQTIEVVFPLHPRTRKRLDESGFLEKLERKLRILPPVGYLEFLSLMIASRLILTDSGGVQEEATVVGVPCLTLRENTERPITIELGTNRLVGRDPKNILFHASRVIQEGFHKRQTPAYWDGRAASRIVEVLVRGVSQAPRVPTDAAIAGVQPGPSDDPPDGSQSG